MTDRIPEIRSRAERAIDAVRLPWAIRPYLAGECIIAKGSGNVTVCEFNEEDEPQTAFILNAPSDVRYLLAILADREALLTRAAAMLREHCPDPDAMLRDCGDDAEPARWLRDLAAHDAQKDPT